MTMIDQERVGAMRRYNEIKDEIKNLSASQDAPDERLRKWEALLKESIELQAQLEADDS